MASPKEKRLAASVLALTKRGGNVPPHIRAACRRVLQGLERGDDIKNIKQFIGVSRSGASKALRQVRGLERMTGLAVQVGQSAEMIAQGGAVGGAGVLNLIKIGSAEIEKLARSKTMKNVFEKVAQSALGDAVKGRQAFYALGRFVKMGGAVVQAAAIGAEIGEAVNAAYANHLQAEHKRNLNQGLAFDASQETLDYARSRRDVERAKRQIDKTHSSTERWMRQYFDTGFEDEVSQDVAKATQIRSQARNIVAGQGNAGAIFAKYAKDRNKDVSELTASERKAALDDASESIADADTFANDPRVATEMRLQESRERNEMADKGGLLDQIGYMASEVFFSGENFKRRQKQAMETVAAQRRAAMDPKRIAADNARFVELTARAMTPTQRQNNRDAEAVSQGVYDSFRSRHHMAWNND